MGCAGPHVLVLLPRSLFPSFPVFQLYPVTRSSCAMCGHCLMATLPLGVVRLMVWAALWRMHMRRDPQWP